MMFFLTSTFSISAKELVRAFELSLGQGIKGTKDMKYVSVAKSFFTKDVLVN